LAGTISHHMKTITFLSDFGTDDWFVAAVKGEILKIAPAVRIVDITHKIRPYDVRSAAFVLSAVFGNFPKGSIHLAVVDPGVGSERKPLIVRSQGHLFVGPDNGIFSRIYDKSSTVYEIRTNAKTSVTFHARDIFGPAAARLARGGGVRRLGKIHKEFAVHKTAKPAKKNNIILGEIAYIDHFGNCITNIPNREEITELRVLERRVNVMGYYGAGSCKDLVGVKGSLGYYEIASYAGSASQFMKADLGIPVEGHI
jgi:S-adenosylmethionine hydrolase